MIGKVPADHSVDSHFRRALQKFRQIFSAKMPFGFCGVVESDRRFLAQSRILGDLARFLFPALNHLGILQDFDLPLIFRKTHPDAKALVVQTSKLWLIGMMICRAEKNSAKPAACDAGEVSFYR